MKIADRNNEFFNIIGRMVIIVPRILTLIALTFSFICPTTLKAGGAITTTPEPAPVVTLKDAVRSALAKTEAVPLGEARINQADARIDQARSRFFPALSFGANFQQQDASGVLSQQSSNLFGGRQSYTRFSLSQSIYEGGRDQSALSASKFDKEVQRQNLSVAGYATFTNVARGFYAILSGEREAENLNKTIAFADDRVKELRNRAKIGRSRNIELMAAQAQLSVLEAQLAAVEGQLVVARDQFILTTGLPQEVRLMEKREKPDPPKTLDEYLSHLDKRPDVAAVKAQIESTKHSIDTAKAGHLPSIGVAGNYYITREGTQQGNNWDVGGTLTLPLFAGGLVKAQVRETSEKLIESEFLLKQTRRQAEISIRTAYNNLLSAFNQLKALDSALESTEDNYREQEKNYRFGQATNLDVIQALNTFQDTKRTLDKTRFLALSAWAELKAATAQVSLAQVMSEGGGGL
ncbi:MAG: TolC family protein [Bdellovibrionia bacterium]